MDLSSKSVVLVTSTRSSYRLRRREEVWTMRVPNWLWVLIAVLVVLAILFLLGINVRVD
jgi:L-asparagine transporter-like permease